MQYGFVLDQRRCIGCHACTVACKSENDVPLGDFRTWVKYTEVGEFPAVRRHFAVLRCNQCTAAPCVTICPVTALDKRRDGIVDLDKDVCIGCKACMQACPYDALHLNEATGGAEKCHFCAHRVEQGLKPACEVVCPETAIISGDLHDPQSPVSRILAEVPGAMVRRPEQGTGPNVFYLGAHAAALEPGTAHEPETFLWSDRRLPPAPLPAADAAALQRADARTVLNASHKLHWGWKVSAYLVTKGIAAGASLWAPFVAFMPTAQGVARDYVPELLALLFLGLTNVLLVLDLKRPKQFLSILLRPNTRSWLVKGAWVLIAFGTVTGATIVARLLGIDGLADGLRWTNLVGGSMAAAYTAFLFAQCEGRDLWQRTPVLLPHLLVQALCVGGAALLPFVPDVKLGLAVACLALVHHGLGLFERFGHHETHNAKMAAALLPTVRAWPGSALSAFHAGMATTSAAAVLGMLLLASGVAHPVSLALCALLVWAGLFLYEQAYVRAGQLPPLS
ncbi:MAG TPA: 4Fe-4S dicluster domain-containing protein [Planctomycetota bacterium]|nr:4Fe-4S dicluster domain-containing protein [Planctomycetota bacterium]